MAFDEMWGERIRKQPGKRRGISYKTVQTPVLEVAYEERGAADASPVILVHGFPDDIHTWGAVAGRLIEAGYRTLAPYVRGFGPTRFLSDATRRTGQIAALTRDVIEFADAAGIDRFTLVGHDWGARAAYGVAALHPERVTALVTLSVGYGTSTLQQVLSAAQARAYWYQWYFALDRGESALAADPAGFCQTLWRIWSPGWRFSEEEFAATAQSFQNPDFVPVTMHSYRHRWGLAPGDPAYHDLDAWLATCPPVSVPAVMLHGADDGATLPESSEAKDRYFQNGYTRRVLSGVGHFIQRERPEAVVEAVFSLGPR